MERNYNYYDQENTIYDEKTMPDFDQMHAIQQNFAISQIPDREQKRPVCSNFQTQEDIISEDKNIPSKEKMTSKGQIYAKDQMPENDQKTPILHTYKREKELMNAYNLQKKLRSIMLLLLIQNQGSFK